MFSLKKIKRLESKKYSNSAPLKKRKVEIKFNESNEISKFDLNENSLIDSFEKENIYEKKIILLPEELYDIFKKKFNNIINGDLNHKERIKELSIIINEYDAAPEYIKKYINLIENEKNFMEEYRIFMNYLDYYDRIEINQKIIKKKMKCSDSFINILNNEKNFDLFKKVILLLYLKAEKFHEKELKVNLNLIKETKQEIDNIQKNKDSLNPSIPLLEGSEETIFFYLINVIKQQIFKKKNKINVFKKCLEFIYYFFYDIIDSKKGINEQEFFYYIINENLNKRFSINLKIYYCIIFTLSLHMILLNDDEINKKEINNYKNFYYENFSIKYNSLRFQSIKIYLDKEQKYEIKSQKKFVEKLIKNEPIFISNKYGTFEFNPNFYICSNLNFKETLDDIKIQLESKSNFSVYYYYYNNDNINIFPFDLKDDSFKEYYEKLLSSNLIDEIFNMNIDYQKYENPFKGERATKMINYLRNKTIRFPFIKNTIDGITEKILGIIALNSNCDIVELIPSNKTIIYNIEKTSSRIITILHEYIMHAIRFIIHSNNNQFLLSTPIKSFLNEETIFNQIDKNILQNYDGGDKLEGLIFGKKINSISFKMALKILTVKTWENKLENIKTIFLINKEETFNYKLYSKDNELLAKIFNVKLNEIKKIPKNNEVLKESYTKFRNGIDEKLDSHEILSVSFYLPERNTLGGCCPTNYYFKNN